MQKREIRIEVLTHKKSGLKIARSPDLAGLVVHGATLEEIEKKLPIVMKALLEAEGHIVDRVELLEDDVPPTFEMACLQATAHMQLAA